MSKRAAFTKADLNRAVEVAKEHGFQVIVDNAGTIRLLPVAANSPSDAADLSRRMREAFGK